MNTTGCLGTFCQGEMWFKRGCITDLNQTVAAENCSDFFRDMGETGEILWIESYETCKLEIPCYSELL